MIGSASSPQAQVERHADEQTFQFIGRSNEEGNAILNKWSLLSTVFFATLLMAGCAEMQSIGGSDVLMKMLTKQL